MSQATILIAEDDVNLSEILKTNLVSLGYSVLSAHDGEEAEKLIFANSPDLSLLDIMMPKKSGIEVLEAMKNNPATKDLAAMMLSNLGQKADLDKCKELGAKDYLIKANVSLSDIVKKIDEYLKANPPKERPVKPTPVTAPAEIKSTDNKKTEKTPVPPATVSTNGNGNGNGNGTYIPPVKTPHISTNGAMPQLIAPQMLPQMQQMPIASAGMPMLVQMPQYPAQYPVPQYYMLVPVQFPPQIQQIQIPQIMPQVPQNNVQQNQNNQISPQ
ncbi:MAG: response regulator [Candidatus Gracilibacteria bacterium]